MQNFLVLAGGVYQLPLIQALKRKNFNVVLFDGNPNAVGFKYADQGVVIDISNHVACLESSRELANISGVASIVNEASVVTVAYIAQELGLFGIGLEVAKRATNKVLMRESFLNHKMKIPIYGDAKTIEEINQLAFNIGFPAIIKPVDSSGSRGVFQVNSIDEVESIFTSAINESQAGKVIIESFLDGVEFTVEAYSINGNATVLGFSQKKRVPFPACVSIELQYMPFEDHESGRAIVEAALDAIRAVGIENGPSHTEIIMTNDGPYVVEIAARGGGFRIFPEIIEAISGVDPIDLIIEQSIGNVPSINKIKNRAAVLRFFTPNAFGTISGIYGVEMARKVNDVVDVFIEPNLTGKIFNGITKDGDRPGYILTISEDINGAVRAADEAEKMVSFEIS
jgi:biotin carboxylase